MQFDLVKLIDGIVRGAILGVYDFVRLTFLGLGFAVVRRSRRFWPSVISLTSKLSSLTFLFLWIFLAASLYIQPTELPQILLKGLSPNTSVVIILICALVLTVAVDILIRLACRFIASRTRRAFYETLFRVAVGILYLGAIVFLFLPRFGLPGFTLFRLTSLANLELGLFALPLAVVVIKAARVRRTSVKAAIMVGAVSLVPYVVLISGYQVFFPTYTRVTEFFQPKHQPDARVEARYLLCVASANGQIKLTGYVKLEGMDFLAFSPHDFHLRAVNYKNDQKLDLGRPVDKTVSIALKEGQFVNLTLESTPVLKPGEILPEGQFPCSVFLHATKPEVGLREGEDIKFVTPETEQ